MLQHWTQVKHLPIITSKVQRFGIYLTDSKLTQYLIVSQISLQLPQQQERW